MVSLLVVAYEFSDPLFSGNGTFCRTLVNGLLKCRTDINVVVMCASPRRGGGESYRAESSDRLRVIHVDVNEAKWGRLDRQSDWETFRLKANQYFLAPPNEAWGQIADSGRLFDIAFCVDWTGFAAMQSIKCSGKIGWHRSVYLNFRVFAISSACEEERAFYRDWEALAAQTCDKTIALSQHDKAQIENMSGILDVEVLWCPVRDEILEAAQLPLCQIAFPQELLEIAKSNSSVHELLQLRTRRFITCAVRLSPEKEAHRFVAFVRSLKGLGYIPLLVGSVGDADYAEKVRSSLITEWPDQCVILKSFVSSHELASIFRLSIVNIHPCSYDAFGMTITEAAACFCPTIIIGDENGRMDVGALALLSRDGCICAAPSDSANKILKNGEKLARVTHIANIKACAYNAKACGTALAAFVGLPAPGSIHKVVS